MEKSRIKVPGKNLAQKVQELFRQGDVRRVCLMEEGNSLMEIPISDPAAPASAIKAPVLAALQAFGTLVNECTLEVERTAPDKAP